MAVFKQFNTNQVVVAPFNANKRFAYSGNAVTASNVGIEYYQSYKAPYKSGSYTTGFTSKLDGTLVFSSVKQLYYSNYLTQSTGDDIPTGSLLLGLTSADNITNYGIVEGPRYDNFLQTSLTQSRYFAQFSESLQLGPSVISIPSKLFGEVIPPSTFQFEYTSSENYTRSLVKDDGEGNLLAVYNSGEARPGVRNPLTSEKVGDIFYSQGMAIFTGPDSGSLSNFPKNMGLGGVLNGSSVANFNTDSSSIQFSSSIQIRENQYKCVIRDNEYSFTGNPSALKPIGELNLIPNQLSGSISDQSNYDGSNAVPGTYTLPLFQTDLNAKDGTVAITIITGGTISDITVVNPGRGYKPNMGVVAIMSTTGGTGLLIFDLTLEDVTNQGTNNQNSTYYDFLTGSYFSPYVTTIGLYNESYQLIAVGKLAQPIPISLYVDTTFVVNFDTW